VILSSN